jgi:hypothetical protein
MNFTYIPRTAVQVARRAHQNRAGDWKTVCDAARDREPITVAGAVPAEIEPVTVAPAPPVFVERRREYIRCVTCGHWRSMHCTRRKLKPGVPTHRKWQGFVDVEGQIQPCSHTLPEAKPYACDSTACATVLGEGEDAQYCPCKKFISPFLKKRTAKPRAMPLVKRTERKFKTLIPEADLIRAHQNYLDEEDHKVKVLIEIATEDPTVTVAQLAAAAERSPSWVRKHLRASGILPPANARGKTITAAGHQRTAQLKPRLEKKL